MAVPPFDSSRISLADKADAFGRFSKRAAWTRHIWEPDICDFVVGNPQAMPSAAYVGALARATVPQHPRWFAYTRNNAIAQEAAARGLADRLGMRFEAKNVLLTNGASGALAVVLNTVIEPGDEVIFISPPWFRYESMIAFAGGTPVRVYGCPRTHQLDLSAISSAMTARTRAIIVNSPNNPTGKIYSEEQLADLGRLLASVSERHHRQVFIISDESYSRVIFDGSRQFVSPARFYDDTFVIYTYAKALLAPGQRLGYIALPSGMSNRSQVRKAVLTTQLSGFGFPDALLQHALPELETLALDMSSLTARRNRLMQSLNDQGYAMEVPDGAWYLFPRSPIDDDVRFAEILAGEKVFVLPGSVIEAPGRFRISLTATDEMIDRAIPRFEAAIRSVRV